MKTFKEHQKSLHEQAVIFKNTRRHQHDGGRAWIKDGQLHEAIRNVNPTLTTVRKESK
jgi:hypothetical protein